MSCAKEIVNCLSTECHSCFSEFCGQLTRSDKLSVCSGDRHGHQCDGARDQGAVITYSGNFYLSMLRRKPPDIEARRLRKPRRDLPVLDIDLDNR
jgi:hypothetical protein